MTTTADIKPKSELQQKLGNSASLLEAIDAATNWPAFLLLSATWVATMLSTAVFGALSTTLMQQSMALGMFSGFVSVLVVGAILLVGINATGILLSDTPWGQAQRSIGNAILTSAFTCYRLLAVLVIEFVLFFVFMVALTLVLFICKIPGLGPLLYAVVFPIGAIATGIVVFSLFYISIPLAAPAVWSGLTIKHTLLMLQAVARKRLLNSILMMVLMGLMIFVVVVFVWSILGLGTLAVTTLSSVVLGFNGWVFGHIMNMMLGGGGFGSGYLYAAGFGGAILLLVGANPGLLIGLKGMTIIYRDVSAGLSLAEDEKEMDRHFQNMKERAEKARDVVREQVAEASRRAQEAASAKPAADAAPAPEASPVPESTVKPATNASVCSACHAKTTPQDTFCGECGHRL